MPVVDASPAYRDSVLASTDDADAHAPNRTAPSEAPKAHDQRRAHSMKREPHEAHPVSGAATVPLP
ncbi:MAG: hypothetical protein QOI48_2697 [Solirubrobacteraceae bacterium]|nr:hypothetical protein [Solirubrobacteraceae bacterium]